MNQHVDDLKEWGIHPSYQRVRILEFLRHCQAQDFGANEGDPASPADGDRAAGKGYHPTAEQIHACLVQDIPTLSKTTVYNTLKLFEDKGLISSVMIDQPGALRYDRHTKTHVHLLCNCCGELLDWSVPAELEAQLAKLDASGVNSWQLILRGDCDTCRLQHSA